MAGLLDIIDENKQPKTTPLLDSVSAVANATRDALVQLPKAQVKKIALEKESLDVEEARVAALETSREQETERRVAAREEEAGFIGRQEALAERIKRNNQMNPVLRNIFSVFDSSFRNQDVREDTLNLNNEVAVFQGKETAATQQALANVQLIEDTAKGKQGVFALKSKVAQSELTGTLTKLDLLNKMFTTNLSASNATLAQQRAIDERKDRVSNNEMTPEIAKQLAGTGKAQKFGGVEFTAGDLQNINRTKQQEGFRHTALRNAATQDNDAFRDWTQLDFLKEQNIAAWKDIQADDGVVRNSKGEVVDTIAPSVMTIETTRRLAAQETAAKIVSASIELVQGLQKDFMRTTNTISARANGVLGENNLISVEAVKNASRVVGRPITADSNQAQIRAAQKDLEDAAVSQATQIDSAVDKSGVSKPVAEQTKRFIKDQPPVGGVNATKHIIEASAAGGAPGLPVDSVIRFSQSTVMRTGRMMNDALNAGSEKLFNLLNAQQAFPTDLDFNDPSAGNLMLNRMLDRFNKDKKPDDPQVIREVSNEVRDVFQDGMMQDLLTGAPTFAADVPYVSPKDATGTQVPHPYSAVSPQQHRAWLAQARKLAGPNASGEELWRALGQIQDADRINEEFHPDFPSAADALVDMIGTKEITEQLNGVLESLGDQAPIGFSAEGDWKRQFQDRVGKDVFGIQDSRERMKAELTGDFNDVTRLYGGDEATRSASIVNAIGADNNVPEQQIEGFLRAAGELSLRGFTKTGAVSNVPLSNIILDPDAFEDAGVRAIQKIMIKNWDAKGRELDFTMSRMHTKLAIERNQ